MVVADSCHTSGMNRVRISTTVDEATLRAARALGLGSDAVTMDAALAALVASHRGAEIDRSYEAYERLPLDTPDAWGDIASFMAAIDGANRAVSRPGERWPSDTPER